MIISQKLASLIEPFTTKETIYKEIYRLQSNNLPIDGYLKQLKDEGFPVIDLYIKKSDNNDRIDCLFYPFDDDISIARHLRYHPPFLHNHQFFEIIYQIKGTSKNKINGNVFLMNEGDICIIPPGPIHSVEVLDDSLIINILIKMNSLNDIVNSLCSDVITNFFLKSCEYKYSYNCLMFHTHDDYELHSKIEELILECYETDKHSVFLRKTILLTIFNYLLRNHSNDMQVSTNDVKLNPEFYQIYQYLQWNYKTATLKEAARRFNYSPVYFSKMIHKNIGKTFYDILLKIKLSNACRMLITTKMPVQSIAYEIGYGNAEYFCNVFKKYYGVTPTEYRKGNIVSFIEVIPEYRKPYALQS